MRILLDECVPRRLKRELSGHTVLTVPDAGWASIKNGALLKLAEKSFDAFVTVDRGIRCQQNLSIYNIAVVVIVVRQNKFESLQPLMPALLQILEAIKPGEVVYIGRDGGRRNNKQVMPDAQAITSLVESNPNVLSGMPVFVGTRVPVKNLFDYLEGGDDIDEFLDDFPTVGRTHAIAVLEMCKQILESEAARSPVK